MSKYVFHNYFKKEYTPTYQWLRDLLNETQPHDYKILEYSDTYIAVMIELKPGDQG